MVYLLDIFLRGGTYFVLTLGIGYLFVSVLGIVRLIFDCDMLIRVFLFILLSVCLTLIMV